MHTRCIGLTGKSIVVLCCCLALGVWARGAQQQPLGREGRAPAAGGFLVRFLATGIQQCHDTGSRLRLRSRPQKRKGEPATRSPLAWNPCGSAGSTGIPADLDMVGRLFGSSLRRHRHHRHVDAAFGFGAELDVTIHQGEQGVIPAQADIAARMPLGAALARQNVAGDHGFAAENLEPEALAVGVAAVT